MGVPGRAPTARPSCACSPPGNRPTGTLPRTPASSKRASVSHRQRSPAPSGRTQFRNPTFERPLLRAPFPAGGSDCCRTGFHGLGGEAEPAAAGPRLSAGLARFQEEPRAGRRQQGAGALAARRVRGPALPTLRLDAGEDAERLPRPAGEGAPEVGGSPEHQGAAGQPEGRGCAPKHTWKGRRKVEGRGCEAGPQREMEIWTGSPVVVPKVPPEGSRALSPEPSHAVVAPGLPTGQIPWGVPGRWPPCPIVPALAPPPPLGCISCCLPGGPICGPHRSWQPLPRVPLLLPDTWHLSDTYFRSLSLFSLSIVKRALAWQAIKSHTPVFRPTPTPSQLQHCWELAWPLQDLVSSPTG